MGNVNHFKDVYQGSWELATARAKRVAQAILADAGLVCEPAGLGADSTAYIKGTAKQNGHERSEPDWNIKGTNHYVEVTGPLNGGVSAKQDLWVRPDKVLHARVKYKRDGRITWCVHCIESQALMRVIPLHVDFSRFRIGNKSMHGGFERYYEVPANSSLVYSWDMFIDRLFRL